MNHGNEGSVGCLQYFWPWWLEEWFSLEWKTIEGEDLQDRKLKATKTSFALILLKVGPIPLPLNLSGLCGCFNSWIMFHVILCQCLDPCPKRSATLLCFLEHLFLESEAPCEKYDKSCLLHSKETQAMWTDHEGRNHTNCNGDEDRKERQRENHVWKRRNHFENRSFNPRNLSWWHMA